MSKNIKITFDFLLDFNVSEEPNAGNATFDTGASFKQIPIWR